MRCVWPFGAMGDGPSQRASQFLPRVTASDVPASPFALAISKVSAPFSV